MTHRACNTRRKTFRPAVEQLEDLTLPSSTTLVPQYLVGNNHVVRPAVGTAAAPAGFNPTQVQHAYGIDAISFQNGTTTVPGDGRLGTVAIVDAYDDPQIGNELATFDSQFGLATPTFIKVGLDSNGNVATTSSTMPPADSGWAGEIALDVEWVHAVAPGATILLVEAHSASDTDLMRAVDYARNYQSVVAVSMSWGGGEFGGESGYDSHFTTPTGHNGVTFFGSSGDSGSPAIWPALSSHVIGVGGTKLALDGSGNYSSESGWSGSGGSVSQVVSQPSYQSGLTINDGVQGTINAGGMRAGPDVAYNADPNSGVAVYSSYGFGGWAVVGGTSAGSPQWAALTAIADEGLGYAGVGSLDGYTQTLPDLYKLSSGDFHDVTTGSNGGFTATTGFDLVTGLGTPVANKLVADLIAANTGGGGGGGTSNAPPTVATGAHVVSSTNTTVTLNAVGADDTGEANLRYTWSLTGTPPAGVTYTVTGSTNGTNAAKTVLVTFSKAGTYNFVVTITDPGGLTASSPLQYTVSQVAGGVSVSPSSATVGFNATRQFSATELDQFNAAITTQPAFAWSIDAGGVGSVNPTTGLYTAPSTAGNATVRATAGTLSGTAAVTVNNAGPTITTGAHIVSQSPTQAVLNVAATDPAGAGSLTYTWALTGTPPGSVGANRNGNNAAQTITATFNTLGTYNFIVTVRDAAGLTATGTVTVTVSAVLTTLTVTPGSVTLAPGATQAFTAAGKDQFGGAFSNGTGLTWSLASGPGAVSTTGVYSATGGSGTAKVQAKSGTVVGQATVTVQSTASGVVFSDNFESGAGQWQVHSGRYYLVVSSTGNHRLLVVNNGEVSRIVAGDPTWTNYSYQATMTLLANNLGSLSLLGRVQDDNHLYFFGWNDYLNAWTIARKDGPGVTTLLAMGGTLPMSPGMDYTVRADMYGSSLALYVNGILQVAVTDSTYASGRIGFSSTYDTGTIDDVVVTAGSTPPAARASATSAATVLSAYSDLGVGSSTKPLAGSGLQGFVVASNPPPARWLLRAAFLKQLSGLWQHIGGTVGSLADAWDACGQ
jgi:hypothetical protein